MALSEARRRASYGPTSPTVGERGARTRSHVVAVALELFAEQGFHATLVEDIARRAGVSRATMYQYFASKEELFVELVEESGAALQRDLRELGPLGPTAGGFANLCWWLDRWAHVYDRYATVFVEWAHVSSPKASLQPLLARFTETYTGRLAGHFERSGVTDVDPRGAALVLFTLVERFEYMRHTRQLARDDVELAGALAVAAQLYLFPRTPTVVLARPGGPVG